MPGLAMAWLDALTSYYTDDIDASVAFTRWLTETVRSIAPDAYLVGEVWADQSVYSRYYESGIDSLFDFRFAGDSGVITQVAMGSRSAAKLAEELRRIGKRGGVLVQMIRKVL